MDITAGRYPAAPTLLVRRATLVGEQDVAALLRAVPIDPRQVADLIRQDGVFVLADLTLPLSARPVGAVAFRYDRAGTARLAGIGVPRLLRRRGLGRRLLTGALMLLRAEGFVQVCAWVEPGGAAAVLLASAGFVADGDAARPGGRSRFVLLL